MAFLKQSLGGFLVSNTTIYSIIFALISLSDYLWVAFEMYGVTDQMVFLLYVVVLSVSTFKCHAGNIRFVYLFSFAIFAFFILTSSFINADSVSYDALSVFLSYAAFFICVVFLLSFDKDNKLNLLSGTLFFYLAFSLFLELLNKVSGGNNLIIIFQNNISYLLVVIFFIGKQSSNGLSGKGQNYYKLSVACFGIYLLYGMVELGNYRLQFKAIALSIFVLIYFFYYKFLVRNSTLFKLAILFCGSLFFLFSGLLFDRVEDIVNSYGRMGSGALRLEVALAILEEFISPYDFIFGLGPGASGQVFPIFYSGNNLYLSSHAGFSSVFLDYGILGGGIFFILPIVLVIFKLISSPFGFYNVFIILFCWVYLNVLYISAIPTANVYNFAMLPLLIQMVVILLSKRECK